MGPTGAGLLRAATAADGPHLLALWARVFEEGGSGPQTIWRESAAAWFESCVEQRTTCRFPVVEADGGVVATAIGTLELGVPNPQCPHGRTVRLANVITLPEHRGRGHGTVVVLDVVRWARTIGADRVDLSATPAGRRIYERVGFELTKAPRMKLVL